MKYSLWKRTCVGIRLPYQRRLSRPILPQQSKRCALVNTQCKIVERGDAFAVGFGKCYTFDDWQMCLLASVVLFFSVTSIAGGGKECGQGSEGGLVRGDFVELGDILI